jgi:hypothetical protein
MRLVDVPQLRNLTHSEVVAYAMACTPGIRLTLTQGTSITTSDVTGATSIYAEPMNGGVVPLFKDAAGTIPRLMLLQASTLSLALGTLASATIPNDVFAYDAGAGSVGLEKLAWTSGGAGTSARATAVDLVNGRYYKSGDFSRLLVGTFYPTATTTVEDSKLKRFLFNVYNRRERNLAMDNTTGHSYNGGYREFNGGTSRVEFCLGLAEDSILMGVVGEGTPGSGSYAIMAQNLNVTSVYDSFFYSTSSSAAFGAGAVSTYLPAVGYNWIAALESSVSLGASTFTQIHLRGRLMA